MFKNLKIKCLNKKRTQTVGFENRITLPVFTAGSLEMTPVPEQGASKSTLSKPPITYNSDKTHIITTIHIKSMEMYE